MARGPELFKLDHVTQRFRLPQGDVTVLNDVSFTAAEGEFIAIVGPSGAGKSTILRLISGLLKPSQGQVIYKGKPLGQTNLEAALVFQNFGLLPWLTVAQNVELGLEPRGLDRAARRKRVATYIAKVGLEGYEEAYPRELSGGMNSAWASPERLPLSPRFS